MVVKEDIEILTEKHADPKFICGDNGADFLNLLDIVNKLNKKIKKMDDRIKVLENG